jgi:membrane-anchored protein YejM (alkaline phosphatase superfamily)
LIDTLVDKDYDFGLFSGDNFDDDLYGETVFRRMSFNGIAFNESQPKDMQAIDSWAEWAKQRTNKPWFSFIELTTVDNFQASKSTNKESSTSDKLRSSYIRSVKQADLELERLLSVIQKMELDKSTVIVITSNHATEFNETNTNSWGSNSNYSQYQLRVPMLIHWPGKVAGVYPHRTSHLDFSVTLLQELLGVTSNPTDFSSGESLFDEHKRRWILAGDSRELALITKDTTTVIDKFGNYKLFDENYQRVKDDNPTLPILMQGLTELQRFYAKNGQ